MSKPFPKDQLRSLALECIKKHGVGDQSDIRNGVVMLAIDRGLYDAVEEHRGRREAAYHLRGADRDEIPKLVSFLMWEFMLKGIVVFGSDETNSDMRCYRITEHGRRVAEDLRPQPYDPDGFLTDFRKTVPSCDEVIFEYLEEAVITFNHGCPRASMVMLGAASEKAILLLIDAFASAVADASERSAFQKACESGSGAPVSIATQYGALKQRLDKMCAKKSLPRGDLSDTVQRHLSPGFDLIRACRNAAGHPEAVGTVDNDIAFLNLRIFGEYVRRVYALIDHFSANEATW